MSQNEGIGIMLLFFNHFHFLIFSRLSYDYRHSWLDFLLHDKTTLRGTVKIISSKQLIYQSCQRAPTIQNTVTQAQCIVYLVTYSPACQWVIHPPPPPPKETWKRMQEPHLKSELVYKSVWVISSAVKKQSFTSSHIQVAVKKVDVTCEWVSNYLHGGCRNCYTLYANPMCTTCRTSMISPITWQPGNGIAYLVLVLKTSCPSSAIKTYEQFSVYLIL